MARKKKGGPPAPKSTEIEVESRVSQIIAIRLEGAQFWDIVKYGEQMGWGVSESSVQAYLIRADAAIRDSLMRDRQAIFDAHIAKRQMLYGRCVTTGEHSTALAVLKDEADLLDLYPARKTQAELTGKGGGPIQNEHGAADDLRPYLDAAAALAAGLLGAVPAGLPQGDNPQPVDTAEADGGASAVPSEPGP